MTRFLPLTRGGWPAEVLCEVTDLRDFPLCVKHTRPNGNVSVEMHMLDGGYSRDYECNYDLIPAPEPSEAAVKAAVKMGRTVGWTEEERVWAGLRAAYAIDGITPKQHPDRVAKLEEEVAKLTSERDQARHDDALRFVDWSDAREEIERLNAELDRYRNWKPSKEAASATCLSAYHHKEGWMAALLAGFRADFPDTQPGTGEQA